MRDYLITDLLQIDDFKKIESKKYLEIKKQFDDLIFEIVKTRTLNYSEEINSLVKQISPQIEKINNLLEERKIRS